MITSHFPPEEFTSRRAQVFDAIGPRACALVQGAGPVAGFELFRQTNEFFYLTGIAIPQAYLLLDGRRRTAGLYLPYQDPHAASEGTSMGAEDSDALRRLHGVDAVYGLERLAVDLADAASVVYTPHSPAEGRWACQDTLRHAAKVIAADLWEAVPSREERFIMQICACRPDAKVRDLSPILNGMRLIKSQCELAVMRRAGALCAHAVMEAIRSTRPGYSEYHLAAVADYVYRVNGVRSEAYRPIIAGGENIWYAHYYRNNAVLRDGDLVLMDYAPDVCYYTSDIGRMWPVNGRYSPLQRELYGFIVRYHKALLSRIRAGTTPRAILADAAAEMRPIVEGTTFSQPAYAQAARRTLEFQGHLSHPVGMAVHDVGDYSDRPMESGLVIAVDPQMWVPEERLYIRVEDTVAVTPDGAEVLTGDCPIDLEAMEALMNGPGLLQQFPPSIKDEGSCFG